MEKKGGMRTNWSKRWFHLKDLTLTYYETNKVGVGKSEKGKVRACIACAIGQARGRGGSVTGLPLRIASYSVSAPAFVLLAVDSNTGGDARPVRP